MSDKIDSDAAKNAIIALGAIIGVGREPAGVSNPRPAIFTSAAVGDELPFREASRNEGVDNICLFFGPGREKDGPIRIDVWEERNGELTEWRNCSPWMFSPAGPCELVADGGDVGFSYDGESIMMVWGIPQNDMAARKEAGWKHLREAAWRVPGDIPRRRLR